MCSYTCDLCWGASDEYLSGNYCRTVAELPFLLGVIKKQLFPQQMQIFFQILMIFGRSFLHDIFLNKIYATEYYSSEQIFFRGIEMPDIVLNC